MYTPAVVTLLSAHTHSIEDFVRSVLHISDVSFNPDDREKMSGVTYELPNGYAHDFIDERLRLPEALLLHVGLFLSQLPPAVQS
jgi:hypothetical protein